jgi:NTE family protein
MTPLLRLPVVLAALTVGVAAALGAQSAPPRAPRVGLVLSGGGARGIAHIGVLRVLEAEGISPDVVTGASMGALVGGLYAIGYTPAALDSIATSLEWASYFRDAPERRFLSLDRRFTGDRTILTLPLVHGRVTLPSGAVSGQRISELLSRLTWDVQTERDFRRFPRPFAAIGTDIETGEPVVLDSGSLAEALQASMSIPSLFPPARVNGRLLIDGGITRNLPARDARALGADILICSDVSAPLFPASRLHSLVDVLMQTVTIYTSASNEAERALCDVYIHPSADGLTAADFGAATTWIENGVAAAAAVRPALREVAARTSAGGEDSRAIARVTALDRDPVHVAAVLVEGISGAAERSLRERLQLPARGEVTAEQLDAAVERAYATELFDRVRYRLDVRGTDTVAVVSASVSEQDRVGIGLRYDNTYEAALLLTARLRNRIGFGSTTQFDLRIGEQFRVAAHHVNIGIRGSRLAIEAVAAYNSTPLPLYADGQRIAEARADITPVTAFAGLLLGDGAVIGAELKGEYSHVRASIAGSDTVERGWLGSGALVIRSSTLDRATFPTRGHLVALRSEHAVGEAPFAQHVGHALFAVALGRRLAAHVRATVGESSGDTALPSHYVFTLGGAYPSALFPETHIGFAGLRPQERAGSAVARFGAALQLEVRRDIFLTGIVDVGYAGRVLTLDQDVYETGAGLAIGALTPVGPIELSIGSLVKDAGLRAELSLGFHF